MVTERCPFCGLHVETPCDVPPPTLCATASEHLLQRALPIVKPYHLPDVDGLASAIERHLERK